MPPLWLIGPFRATHSAGMPHISPSAPASVHIWVLAGTRSWLTRVIVAATECTRGPRGVVPRWTSRSAGLLRSLARCRGRRGPSRTLPASHSGVKGFGRKTQRSAGCPVSTVDSAWPESARHMPPARSSTAGRSVWPLHPGHHHVADDDVDRRHAVPVVTSDRLGAVGSLEDMVADQAAGPGPQGGELHGVRPDDQHGLVAGGSWFGRRAGGWDPPLQALRREEVDPNVVPDRAPIDNTRIWPPISLTMPWQVARPRPVPLPISWW